MGCSRPRDNLRKSRHQLPAQSLLQDEHTAHKCWTYEQVVQNGPKEIPTKPLLQTKLPGNFCPGHLLRSTAILEMFVLFCLFASV